MQFWALYCTVVQGDYHVSGSCLRNNQTRPHSRRWAHHCRRRRHTFILSISSLVAYPPRCTHHLCAASSAHSFRPRWPHPSLSYVFKLIWLLDDNFLLSNGVRLQSGGSGAGLAPLVEFYSKLPKGSATASASKGLRGRFFEGKNASAAPLAYTILAIGGFGYAIDYNSAYPYSISLKTVNDGHIPSSALEYVLYSYYVWSTPPDDTS